MKIPAFIHSFLAVYIPVAFFSVMLLVLLNSVLLEESIGIFPPLYVVLMFLTGVFETLTGNLVHKRRPVSSFRRLRELLVFLIVSFLLVLLLHGNTGEGKIASAGKVRVWLPVVFLCAQWLLGSYLHRLLFMRERFLTLFADADTRRFREVYGSYAHEGAGSLDAIRAFKRIMISMTVTGFAGLMITSWILGTAYTGWALFLVLLFFASFLSIIAMLNTWRERQLLMTDGLIPGRREQCSRKLAGLFLIGAALLIAVPLTGTKAPLPGSYLERFVSWLEELGRFEFARNSGEITAFDFSAMNNRFDNLLKALDPGEASRANRTARAIQIAGWILLGVIGTGICTYLLLPLFRSRSGECSLRSGLASLKRMIVEYIDYIGSVRKRLAERIANRRGGPRKPGAPDLRNLLTPGRGKTATEDSGAAAATRLRKRDGNTLKAFYRRFTRFGERHGALFKATLGPGEYACRVAELVPECAEACTEIATLFEEATYSNHDLEENMHLRFKKVVKKAIKTRRSHS